MSDTPVWLRAAASVAVAAMLLAIGKPTVAPLVLRGLLVVAVAVLVVRAVTATVGAVEPLHAYGRRADPRQPNELPRRIITIAELLRLAEPDDAAPPEVLRVLRGALQHRLWHHHDLSVAVAHHHGEIRRMISPVAAELLWPTGGSLRTATSSETSIGTSTGVPTTLSVPTAAVPALIDEIERL